MKESRRAHARRATAAFTLAELLVALGMVSLLVAIAMPAFRTLDQWSLARSADLAQGQLARARLVALARRETVSLQLSAAGELVLTDGTGRELDRANLQGSGLLALDSARMRPSTIRFNPRGQASPGSVYLYRSHRGVRLISNFAGRVRRHVFRY